MGWVKSCPKHLVLATCPSHYQLVRSRPHPTIWASHCSHQQVVLRRSRLRGSSGALALALVGAVAEEPQCLCIVGSSTALISLWLTLAKLSPEAHCESCEHAYTV